MGITIDPNKEINTLRKIYVDIHVSEIPRCIFQKSTYGTYEKCLQFFSSQVYIGRIIKLCID